MHLLCWMYSVAIFMTKSLSFIIFFYLLAYLKPFRQQVPQQIPYFQADGFSDEVHREELLT